MKSIEKTKKELLEEIETLHRHVTSLEVSEVDYVLMGRKLKKSCAKLQRLMKEAITALALAVEMKDPYTAGHQKRVACLATTIAKKMSLKNTDIEGIRMAGVVHDLGKLYVPAEILNKTDRLSDLEFSIIKTHAERGYEILSVIEFNWPVAQIVWQHHERLNGTGYPKSLRSENILLGAKIISIADVVEAMASHRPYRPALGIDKALEEIESKKGLLYDALATDACVSLFRKGEFHF